MREPWFVAPERCAERGARMQLLGHVGCRCNYCEFKSLSPLHVASRLAIAEGEDGADEGAEWDRARDRWIDEQNEVL